MKTLKPFVTTLVVPGMLFLGACCSSNDVVVAPPPPPPPVAPAPQPKVEPLPPPAPVVVSVLGDIYFDFDKSDIRREAAAQLETNAAWMKAHPNKHVVLEAHCDFKGTPKYNLALGHRRANAAKAYLVKLGIKPDRLKTVSYGKDMPVVQGTNDEVRAENRMIHFVAE